MVLSVIVPLYNCEKYIKSCLESLYRQDLQDDDFEIIVVNDGSTDNGPGVVEEIMGKHNNITLINQTNKGLGLTRNRGIMEAKGEYIAFVDSDDEIHDGAFGKLLSKVSDISEAEAPDMIIFKYQNVIFGNTPRQLDIENCNIAFAGTIQEYGNKYGIHPTACNQIYRSEFVKRFKFNDSCYAEDLQFMVKIFEKTDTKVVFFDLPVYFYYMREYSMIHNYTKDYIKKTMDVYCAIARMINKTSLVDRYNNDVVDEFIMKHIQVVALVKLHSAYFSVGEIKKQVREFDACGILPLSYIPNRIVKLLDFSCRHPYLMYVFSFFFRNIYLKYIKNK